jgi:hypothetical protein
MKLTAIRDVDSINVDINLWENTLLKTLPSGKGCWTTSASRWGEKDSLEHIVIGKRTSCWHWHNNVEKLGTFHYSSPLANLTALQALFLFWQFGSCIKAYFSQHCTTCDTYDVTQRGSILVKAPIVEELALFNKKIAAFSIPLATLQMCAYAASVCTL